MRKVKLALAWVVYKMTVHGKPGGVSAVCEQDEWDAMELDRPGHHALVRKNIKSEAEAEALARSESALAAPPKAPGKRKPGA